LWTATATFTGLPRDNGDFGLKVIGVGVYDLEPCGRECEVFYPRDETNHPNLADGSDPHETLGGGAGNRSPNWFFYWYRTNAGHTAARYDSTLGGGAGADFGVTPAIANWAAYVGQVGRVLVGDRARTDDARRDGSGQVVTGIDLFANVTRHERRHVQQHIEWSAAIGRVINDASANSLLTWAWVAAADANYNHFRDLNGNGTPNDWSHDNNGDGDTDDQGENENLDRDGDCVPNWQDSAPGTTSIPDESERLPEAAEAVEQDTFREMDWGSPGKQHGEDLAAPNARGELNAFDD
jgi:hypothetical protein